MIDVDQNWRDMAKILGYSPLPPTVVRDLAKLHRKQMLSASQRALWISIAALAFAIFSGLHAWGLY